MTNQNENKRTNTIKNLFNSILLFIFFFGIIIFFIIFLTIIYDFYYLLYKMNNRTYIKYPKDYQYHYFMRIFINYII